MKKIKRLSSLKEMQLKSYKNVKGGNAIDEMVFYDDFGHNTTVHNPTHNGATSVNPNNSETHVQCDHKEIYDGKFTG